MRILQIITSMLPGGAERLVVELTPLLISKGHTVDMVCFDGEETILTPILRSCECHIYSFCNKKQFYNPLFIPKLVRIMSRYDVIITHNSSPQLFGAIANIFCKKPLVTTEHNTNNRKRHNWLTRCIDKWMYKRYNMIVCCSRSVKEKLTEYLGYNSKLTIIPNGINLDIIRNAIPINRSNDGKYVITMVASLREQKDHKTLLQAMAKLPKEKFELWLLGEGKLEENTKQLANQLDIHDIVCFHGIKENVASYLKASDIIVLSSHYEGLSLSSIEGMASGKPFIATDVDGLHEVVEGAGVLVPHEDPNALAKAITLLTEDITYRKKIISSCMERASKYDIHLTADLYSKMFENLLNSTSSHTVS